MRIRKLLIPLFSLLFLQMFLQSCVSNKKFIYLQDRSTNNIDSNKYYKIEPFVYKLQKLDILYLSVFTDDEKFNKLFVQPGSASQSGGGAGTQYYFTGFTIDQEGKLELPYIGKLKIAGLSIEETKSMIGEELKKYFKVFFIQLKVAEFKFSVLGSVNHPGQFFFIQNKISIIEAIAQAGDLNEMAKKQAVQLYRQFPDGIKMFTLDLTDRNLMNSPYWYIQPNDVLYIQPLKIRTIGALTSVQSSFAVIAPLLSTLLLVLNTYILVKNLK